MEPMNAAQKAAYLRSQLQQFCGTETWFRHPLFRKFLYTEGVRFLTETAECYWLVDLIFGFQIDQPSLKIEPFQLWALAVHENKTAILTCEDGNGRTVFSHSLNYTDFPLDKIRLFFSDNVLLLPSEY